MKKTIVQCDICGKDITCDDVRFKFKIYENTYVNYEDCDWRKWNKLDMCSVCYHLFLDFIENKRK